jgi:hypothetical protein
MAVTNALAFHVAEIITTVKKFYESGPRTQWKVSFHHFKQPNYLANVPREKQQESGLIQLRKPGIAEPVNPLRLTFYWIHLAGCHDIQYNDVQHSDTVPTGLFTTLSTTALSIKTFKTFKIKNIQHNDIQHNDIQHKDTQHTKTERNRPSYNTLHKRHPA